MAASFLPEIPVTTAPQESSLDVDCSQHFQIFLRLPRHFTQSELQASGNGWTMAFRTPASQSIMKTRERILLTSLELFNTEGEANVSTVDIANEMDISPGNLYYHFKGKQEIISELFNRLESQLVDILEAPLEKSIKTEDAWIYLYVVFEQICNHRYFYRSINDLLHRYPDIDKRFRRLVALKIRTAEAIARELVGHEVLKMDARQVSWLANNVAMQLTFWLNFDNLLSKNTPDPLAIHQGVFQIVSLAAPYLSPQHRYVYDECSSLYEHLIADL